MKKLAPLNGVLFFLVLLASTLVGGNSLKSSSSPAHILAYYQAHRGKDETSAVLTVLAVALGVIFYGQLRDYLRRHDASRGFAATAFGGVLLFAGSGGVSAGTLFALSDSPSHLSASAAQMLNLVYMDVGGGFASAGIAIMLVCFGSAILAGGLLPAWLGWVAFPIGVAAVIPPAGFYSFVGAGVWTLIVSIVMWRRTAFEAPVSVRNPAGATA